jgi:hypothetical protein
MGAILAGKNLRAQAHFESRNKRAISPANGEGVTGPAPLTRQPRPRRQAPKKA